MQLQFLFTVCPWKTVFTCWKFLLSYRVNQVPNIFFFCSFLLSYHWLFRLGSGSGKMIIEWMNKCRQMRPMGGITLVCFLIAKFLHSQRIYRVGLELFQGMKYCGTTKSKFIYPSPLLPSRQCCVQTILLFWKKTVFFFFILILIGHITHCSG